MVGGNLVQLGQELRIKQRTIIVTATGQGFSDEESSRGKKYPHRTT